MVRYDVSGDATALDPGISVGRLVEQRLRTLHAEEQEVLTQGHSLINQALLWRMREQVHDSHDNVEQLTGSEPVQDTAEELTVLSRREVLTMRPSRPSPPDGIAATRQSELRCLRRGIALRALLHRGALEDKATAAHLTTMIEHGAQVRLLDDRFERMLIFDRKAALVQSDREATPRSALLVRQEGLVRTLYSFFDRCWSQAVDAAPLLLPGHTRTQLDAVQIQVLHAMARAEKDEVGARELGISVRTYRGHVAGLLKHLNATTRFQAALRAREKGLI